ncbi:MAG: triose-phosphate isomerase [delta proteobacterium ML8_F1]|nr:MAG: triose-phosphate isomerase [delta proteobacterium ML8_F1]
MRIPVIAGNWKMNKTIREGRLFIDEITSSIEGTDVVVMLFVPYTLLAPLKTHAEGTRIVIGAQNMHQENSGAFTGEISHEMLREIGIETTLIGHSERRQFFGETDATVNLKLKKAVETGFTAVVCVGENLEEREAQREKQVVKDQLVKAFEGIRPEGLKRVIVAYEPVWAIGTGKTATSQEANTMIAFIRNQIKDLYSEEISEQIRILYGGSIKPGNIEELMDMEDIDGGLVGGASLEADSFIQLVNF